LTATGRLAFLAGGGEMGSLIRSHDWSATPLGTPEHWAPSLKTAVGIMLASGYPMYIAWGPGFTQLYNDAYRPILGSTKHPGALGRSTRETFREIWDFIGPMFEGVMAAGTASTFTDQLLALDRHGYVEECYFTFSYSAVRMDSGAVGGVFVTVLETTDRVVRERRERTVRELGELTPRGGIESICAAAARTLARNPHDVPCSAVFFGSEVPGRPWRVADGAADHVPAAVIDAAADWLRDAIANGAGPMRVRLPVPLRVAPWPDPVTEALLVPITAIGHEAPPAWLLGGVSPRRAVDAEYEKFFQNAAAAVGGLIAEAEAFEAERRRAEALAEVDRAKTAFFSNVSHEFRTPLTLMLGPLQELLEDDTALSSDVRTRLEVVTRNAARLLKLVNTLLDFARIEAGRVQAVYEPTDLASLTAELAGVFRSAIERAGLRLDVDCPPLAEPVYVDREMWEKVVLNFLSNALKFTFEGGIRVAMRPRGQHVELVVEDTGTGVPAAEVPRLFERFHRVEGARARTYEGTGIGLALVRELVGLHGGDIAVESEAGRGTRFTVSIPFGIAHLPADRVRGTRTMPSTAVGAGAFVEEALRWLPDERAERSSVPSAPADTHRFRIVLADDNADMRSYVRRLLGERWDVETVADGAQAIDAINRQRPDVVVTDVMMPNVDGFELVRRLRADPATSTIPIIMLSARAGEESRVGGLVSGADDYLVKPFAARELIARVERQLLGALATARRDAEAASRAKDEFFALLGHELRNPLAPIATALHVMRMRGPGVFESERAVIDRQIRHMTRLVDDLLDVSRIARGKIDLQRERLELAEVVRDAVETASPLLEQLGHHLAIDVPARGLVVSGDRVRLAQVVGNLVNNAAKYTPAGGRIELTGRPDGDEITLGVRDNGVGISPDMLPHVFELFVQARQGADRAHGGLGLGLAIAQSVTRLHGGRIVVASDGPGRGSTFIVRLPAVEIGEDARDAAVRESPTRLPSSGYRILVVDDNEDAALMLHYALTLAGHETRIALDGPTALNVARDFRPEVALLDLGLPVMDGLELARRLREDGAGSRLRLVALTGYGQASDRARTTEAGFDAHLVKPIDPEKLDGFIRSLAA
jgi:signal transduction histidine kinase